MVTLRIGGAGLVGVAVGAALDGDAVSDGDVVGADEDVLDEQAQDALTVFDGGGVGAAVQGGEEGFDVGGEGEVVLAVGLLGVDGADLVA
jgi:hypothetical protein